MTFEYNALILILTRRITFDVVNFLIEIKSKHITGGCSDPVWNHGKFRHRRGVVVQSDQTTIHGSEAIELERPVDVLGIKHLVTRTLHGGTRGVDFVHAVDTLQVVTRKSLVEGFLDLLGVRNSRKGFFLLGRK